MFRNIYFLSGFSSLLVLIKVCSCAFNITRFVNLMEGNIWIESDGLGKGCTAIFDVKLGISESSNESKQSGIPKVPAIPRHSNFTGLKVLVMDENGLV